MKYLFSPKTFFDENVVYLDCHCDSVFLWSIGLHRTPEAVIPKVAGLFDEESVLAALEWLSRREDSEVVERLRFYLIRDHL